MSLPSGTVTFLFTDIEGSTRAWQQHPAGMKDSLARHHALLRTAIEAHGGYVFQIIGDAFCAAFRTAPAALLAALAAQRSLLAEEWGALPAIKVRMALHTGSAEVRPGDTTSGEYVSGLTLSRVARLLSAGHGGQVLLSLPAAELVRDQLPPAVALREMGAQRLKDLVRPEIIFQVVAADLPAEFPPLKTLDALPNNLPLQLTSFVGREREIVEVRQLLQTSRLVTLTGVGGSGKTRLALQAAVELLEEYPDGVWFVDLSPISDPAFLVPAVAAPLNLRDEGGRPLIDILLESVRPRQSLFVLDNCEHLIEACARLADQMLHAAPRLRIFATSREGLGVAGEQNFTVPSLALPDPRNLPSAESLAQVDAVRLFIDRAQAVKIDFSVTEANAPAIAQICQRLDGIPLAIELAAARAKAMSAEQIASRLDDSFRLLTGGSRTALPRQQTLQALIDWSWNLLSMAERDVLQRLAVFAGGWRLEAAEVVCAGEGIDSVEVFDLLAGLVNKSLVVVEADDHPQARYHLLQTIRQYAGDKLIATGDGSACRERHLAYYAGLAAQAEAALHSREQRAWLELLEADHDNLRAALEWALGTNPAEALRICAGLTDFWDTRGYLNEGLGWTRRALEAAGDLPPSPVLVKAVYGAATFTSRLASDDQFKMWIDKGLALARQIDDRGGIAMGLHATGMYAEYFLGDPATAYTYYDEALHTWREIGDRLGIGMALGPQATRALNRRDYPEAERLFNESLALFRQVGDRREAAGALWNLAEVALAQDDLPRARALANESLAEYRALEDQHGIATVLRTLGVVAASHADVDQVTTLFAESCMLFREINDRGCLALSLGAAGKALAEQGAALQAREMALEALTIVKEVNESRGISAALEASVSVLLAQGYWAAAARTFAAVLAYRESVQAELTEHEQADQARELAELHVHLDGEAFEREWREGSRMGMQQAIEFALALLMGGERRE